MEEHRLTKMKDNYDEKLFNDIYEKVQPLKRKLASTISTSKLGVEYEDILSWFDIKFIFVFNKYFDTKPPDILKGFIISSLQMFQTKILRRAYSNKNAPHSETIDIQEIYGLESLFTTQQEEDTSYDTFLKLALSFMKQHLSEDAFLVLDIQLNPPLYIIKKLNKLDKPGIDKIPSNLLSEYLSLGDSKRAIQYINELKREIKEVTYIAREHFSSQENLIAVYV